MSAEDKGLPHQTDAFTGRSRIRFRLYALFTVLVSLSISIWAAEWLLAWQRRAIEESDQLQPGMIIYDARLGWRLKPGWFGFHQHHDFQVDYSINRFGLRGHAPQPATERRFAVVGDSFTFGQGVNEEQTFVYLIGEAERGVEFLNFGVPGYSTDQQYLLIRDRVRLFKPDVVLLVVYLGNDLFDNQRPFPLQGDHAKPYFKQQNDGSLVLRNSPVPLLTQPAAARAESLTELVLGTSLPQSSGLVRWLGSLETTRRLGLFQMQQKLDDTVLEQRFASYLQLFRSILLLILESTGEWQAELKLVLLPGQSFVEQPDSLSAGYQDFLRRALLRDLATVEGIQLFDLASALREAWQAGGNRLYHPNEGHLSVAGHQFVAGWLAERLLISD